MMAILVKCIWVLALLFVAGFGVTLSWVMLAMSALCVAFAGVLGTAAGFYSRQRWSVPGMLLLAASVYFFYRAWSSPVWDLAKEDALLLGLGLVVYLVSRCGRLCGAWMLVLAVVAVVNISYFGLQKLELDPMVPMDLVSVKAEQSADFGWFQDYGALGNGMAIMGWVLLCFATWARDKAKLLRVAMAVVGVLALVVAMMSGSRSAIMSIAVAGVLYSVVSWVYSERFAYRLRQRVRTSLVLITLAGCVGLGVLGYLTFAERAGEGDAMPETNIRLAYWGMAVEQAMDSPVTGTGARSFSYECFRHWNTNLKTIEANPEFVHNEYLQAWSDYGLVGLLLMLAALLSHWGVAVYRLYQQEVDEDRHWVAVAGLIGLTVVMVHSLTDFPQRLPWDLCLAAMCLAWCYPRVAMKNREAQSSGKWLQVALVMLQIVISLAVGSYAAREAWAGRSLVESQQVREDGAWEVDTKVARLRELERASEASPDFRRYLNLARLYHADLSKEGATEAAVAHYEKSLERHPYNVVAALGLAAIHTGQRQFEKADEVYASIETYAAARDWWFEFYLTWARNKAYQAYQMTESGDWDAADTYLVEAIDLLGKASSKSEPRLEFMRDVYLNRIRLAMAGENYKKAGELWVEVNEMLPVWVIHDREARVHRSLGELYMRSAASEWKKRDPALAKVLFEKARQFFVDDQNISGKQESWRLERINYIDQQLKLIGVAGF
ncbi:hypothetical protein Rhal01_02848 [Rubritalea halochordaticola]|uniref:O-antigen ligase-related domain-containing protein n=1 Tax=Rubritalea halochordaticola TaxID=714537 RepID=A0ABP9V2B6_9BACT